MLSPLHKPHACSDRANGSRSCCFQPGHAWPGGVRQEVVDELGSSFGHLHLISLATATSRSQDDGNRESRLQHLAGLWGTSRAEEKPARWGWYQVQVRLWGAPRTAGSHPEPVGKSSFPPWLSNGSPQKNSQKKIPWCLFSPFFLLSTHSFNECILKREREKESGGICHEMRLARVRRDGLRRRKTRQDGRREGQILTSLSLTGVQQAPERVLAYPLSALFSSVPSRMWPLT